MLHILLKDERTSDDIVMLMRVLKCLDALGLGTSGHQAGALDDLTLVLVPWERVVGDMPTVSRVGSIAMKND